MAHRKMRATPARVRSYRSPREASARAEVQQETILRWCREGILPARMIVGRWRIAPSELLHGGAGRTAA